MRVINNAFLKQCHAACRCEVCGKAKATEPHHVFTRGWCRLDGPHFVVTVCRACHTLHQEGGLQSRMLMLWITAKRERCEAWAVSDAAYFLKGLDKDATEEGARSFADEWGLSPDAWDIARRYIWPRTREREPALRKRKRRRSAKHEAVLERQREWRKATYRKMKGR